MKIFDAHISGSLSVSSSAEISNNLLVSGNLTVLGSISGSISGSITNADTANKLAEKDVTEFATTGSNSFNGNQTVTGSITATQISSSFTGSGAGLYGIPASGITGLNLSQIAQGSSTASISSTNGLRVNTNTEITGALTISGSISLNGVPVGTGKLDETTFNSYTSSNDSTNSTQSSRLTSIESATGSLNSFTNSIDTTIKNKLNTETVMSGSVQILITGTTGYSTFSGSISSSIGSLSSSIATTDSNQNTRLGLIETSTGSLNTFTSSLSGAVEVTGSNLTVKGNLLVKGTTTQIDSTTLNIGDNIIQLNGTGATNAGLVVRDATAPNTLSGSLLWDTINDRWIAGALGSEDRIILATELTTLSSSLNSRATSLESASGSIRTDFNTYTGSNNTVIGTLQTNTGSLNTFTSSASGRLTSLESASGSIRTDFNSFTSSNNTVESTQNGRLTSLEGVTGSIGLLNTYTGSNNTVIGTLQTATSSINTYTSSASGRLTSIEGVTGSISSLNTFTSSYTTGSFTGSFKGDGTNLYNIPASGVTGLNLTRIADGATTASVSNTNGFRINSNTEITGALKLNKVDLGTDDIVEITVTDSGGKFFINGVRNPKLEFIRGLKYKFLYSNFSQHPFKFSITDNGTHNGGTEYTTGVTMGYSPDYIQIDVTDATASTLYYFCGHHVGMGNSITIYSDFLHGQANIDLIKVDTGILATTGSNNFIGNEKISGSLAVTGSLGISGSLILTGSVDITGSMTLNGQPIGTGKLDETTFQSYTSSNDSRVSSLESSTGSLNTFTSSIDTTIKNKLNTETVISGSVQVLITGTTGYSTFSSSISTSIGSLSSSVATTTSGLSSSIGSLSSSVATTTSGLSSSVGSLSSSIATTTSDLKNRVDSIETSTGSLNSFTSSINTTIKTKLDSESVISGSIQVAITGTTGYSTFSSSIATTTFSLTSSIGSLSSSVATTTSGLSSSIGSLSSSVATTTSELSSSIGSLSSSVATTTLGLSSSLSSSIGSLSSSVATTTIGAKNQIDSIETSTGSLNSFTSSISTTIKDKLNSESVLSGSIQVNITGTTGYGTFSSSIATTTNDLSSSVAITTSGLTSTITSLSSSIATTTLGLSSSIGSLSSSVATTTLTTKNRVDSIESKTGSYATTGSNIFQGTQTITGSLYISQDLIVAGSSSIQNISSSIVNIADNIITVNALNPSVRFGGLAVIDSGSSPQVSGSMLFDSVNNQWIFVHQNQASVTSSVLLMGPKTYNNLGNEGYLTLNRIPKGTGIEHLNDSNITDTGTLVSINSNTEITGTLNVTGNIINPNITAIQSSTGSLNTFTASLLSAIELTGSNLTVRGNLLVKGTTTNVNTSTLDVDNNLINLNGAGAANAGLRVKDTTGVSQLSGSLLWDATNDYWIAGQLGSEQRLVRETEFNNAVTRIGNVESSTGSLNSFTSSINTTIKSKLNSDSVISGSVQVNHNATTNYVANQHIDHTTVSITAGSGLTGGGDISTTRTINVGAGNGITVNADDIAIDTASATFTTGVKSKLNADGVVSGSSQIDGSQLGLNKTITIGSTSTTLGGTSTSLVGLTSVTSTAFTGSLQGNATNVTATSNTSLTSLSNLNTIGTITGGTWNGTAIGDSYISSATNWNTAYNKRISSLGFTSSTVTITLADATTVTVSVPTFNQNTSGTAANITASTNTSLTSLANLATVGTITTGVWNGSAIGNSYLANSSFNIGTTSISLGRASASQTLTGVAIDGNAGSVTNGVYTTGDQTIGGAKTFSSNITNSATADWYMYGFGSRGANSGQYGMGLGSDIANRTLSFHIPNVAAYSNTGSTPKFGWYSNGAAELMTLQSATGNLVVTGTINGLTVSSGTISSGTWNGTAIGDSYISSATNWNTAYNKRISTLGFTSSTVTITLADTTTVTASVPTFNQNTSGTAANITASSNTSLTSLANLATVGTIGTGVWNGSAIATTYTAAKVTAVNQGTGVSVDTTTGSVTVSIGQAVATSSNVTFARVTTPKIAFERNANVANGLSWYSFGTYTAWCDYMANGGSTSTGPTGNITASTGTYVTSWARRFFVEDANTYGWIFEKGGTTSTTPTVVAELRSSDGLFSTAGAIYSAGSLVKTSANSSYSTTFTSVSSVTVTHSLGTKDVAVFVYDSSDNMFWPSSIVTTSTSVVTITFASSRSGRVVVVR